MPHGSEGCGRGSASNKAGKAKAKAAAVVPPINAGPQAQGGVDVGEAAPLTVCLELTRSGERVIRIEFPLRKSLVLRAAGWITIVPILVVQLSGCVFGGGTGAAAATKSGSGTVSVFSR